MGCDALESVICPKFTYFAIAPAFWVKAVDKSPLGEKDRPKSSPSKSVMQLTKGSCDKRRIAAIVTEITLTITRFLINK